MSDDPPPLSLTLALLPIVALFGALLVGALTMGFDSNVLLPAMLFAATIAGLIGARRGAGWAAIQAEAGHQIADALPALLILLAIGALLGSWMFAGTIPLMVVAGIDFIDPRFMSLTAFLATAGMSLVSGTSWGSAGTIGVALMGAATAMGLPLAPVAGAVVSGAYLGDKLSPLSDMTNISAIGAGADLYAHIRHMMATSVPPALIAAIAYGSAGWISPDHGAPAMTQAMATRAALVALYDLNGWAAVPLLVAVAGIVARMAPALVIVASAVVALLIGIVVQGFAIPAALASFVAGFDVAMIAPVAMPVDPALTRLLNRGGLASMAPTLVMVIAAFLLAAAMQVSGAMDRLLHALLRRVRTAFGLIAATMVAGTTMVGMTSHGGVTSLIVGGLFRKSYADRGLAPENLSRAMQDSVAVTEPLLPWTVSGLFMATTLGVATVDLAPWALFCLLSPVASLMLAAWYQWTGRGLKRLTSVPSSAKTG